MKTICLLALLLFSAVEAAASLRKDNIQAKKERLLRLHDGDDDVINIKTLGAVGDGEHNDTEAFFTAMKIVSDGLQVPVFIPEGTFLMWPVAFPCKNARVIIAGTVLAAPADAGWTQSEYFWSVEEAVNCTITGLISGYRQGVISGQGQTWWKRKSEAPSLILFKNYVSSLYPKSGLFDISLINAPGAHVTVQDSTQRQGGPQLNGVLIYSPRISYNTIGVQAINASFFVTRSDISTSGPNLLLFCGRGKDNEGFFGVDTVSFGSGQGITLVMYDGAMGNLSIYMAEFHGTMYGLRVLGASDGTGEVERVSMYSARMIDVGTPLEVSNLGCPLNRRDCKGSSEGVRISSITVSYVTAFQTSGTAGRFVCRRDQPCTDVNLQYVSISGSEAGDNRFVCSNAQGSAQGTNPESCLAQPSH